MEQRTAKEITKLQELTYELKVGQAMTREVITVSPYSTIAEFMEVLRVNRISGTPVVEEGRMIGIISIEDLIKALAAREMNATVGEKMTPNPVTLYADEPLVHAVSKFSELRFGRFPVINRAGELVGIITQGDIARAMLKRLEVGYHEEEIHRYRASHIFEDIIADEIALVLGYRVAARDFERAGEASSGLKRTLSRLGIHPRVIRRVAVATYEAEMNIIIYTDGGEIVAEVRPGRVRIEALDKGPGIPDIEQAMQPGFSTAPEWVREMGFGAGMGLPNIQASADEMKLESTVGVGTHLDIIIYFDERKGT
ncbi:MAG TPA: CBS domain-containing protein [Thermoflexia bacterium]|nr:CBS domain-containing protein [Thermoflexia bacterium]